jgi:hypothetical protein
VMVPLNGFIRSLVSFIHPWLATARLFCLLDRNGVRIMSSYLER